MSERLKRYMLRGAVIDLAALCVSTVMFGGAHYPIGPVFVMRLNYPVLAMGRALFPGLDPPEVVQVVLFLVIACLGGALYGAVSALVVEGVVRRRRRGESKA